MKNILYIIFIAVMLYTVVALSLTSCNLIKEARDNNAINRIMTDSALNQRAYDDILPLHPCIIHDSLLQIIEGNPQISIDSIITVDTSNILDTIYLTKIKTIIKNTIRVDSFKVSTRDVTLLNLTTSKLNQSIGANSTLTAQLATQTIKSNRWFWWFIGACAGWGISSFALVYFKI